MRTTTEELKRGDLVGPYRIGTLLGEGAMGLVYRARDAGGREVALKLIRSELAADERFRRRFEREASAATCVQHPHVVSIDGQGEHGGIPYIARALAKDPAERPPTPVAYARLLKVAAGGRRTGGRRT